MAANAFKDLKILIEVNNFEKSNYSVTVQLCTCIDFKLMNGLRTVNVSALFNRGNFCLSSASSVYCILIW